MKPYPEYKDSGVEWIGEVPSSWGLPKIRYITSIEYGNSLKEEDRTDGEYFVYGSNGIVGRHQKSLTNGKTIIIGRKGSYGKINISDNSCYPIDTTFFIEKNNTKHNLKWLFYGLSILKLDSFTKDSSVPGINRGEIYDRYLPTPPLYEQNQIVSFLDHKTQLIDDLIERTKKKIELLKEKRTALINHCVTKGLNPDAEMKDSGVEWIGEIPIHWEIKKVKYLLHMHDGIKIGPFGSSLKLDTLTISGIKIYGQGNVIKDDFQHGHRYMPFERFEKDFTQYEILDGDVLVTMMGTTGKSKVFRGSYKRGILDSHLLRLRFNKSIFSSYLFSILLEQSDYISHQIKLSSKGSIMEGLNSSIIKELMVLIPPMKEQNQIVEYLDKQTQIIDTTIEKETQRIELLKEYRQSLISAAVTGKIVVRDWNK
jgi:type I restriction enzyme, S subunit